jgi:hypothetical protein
MSNDNMPFSGDLTHLQAFAVRTPKPEFLGTWSTVELQPDAFAPQKFTVGIVVQSHGERLHFKLLDNFKKFECMYNDTFPQKSVREIMTYAEEALRLGVQNRKIITEINFQTSCLSLSSPQFTSGDDREATVERLFDEVVVMALQQPQKKGDAFVSIDTPHVRELVNDELKLIASLDYERIVNSNNQGFLLEEAGVRHYLDLNLMMSKACGSVTSAFYKTSQTVELNLLKSSRDLTTYSRLRKIEEIGLFLLMPDEADIELKEYKRIKAVIEEYEWKLEQDGFRVVSLASPKELALEVYTWAKPMLA